MIGNVVDIESNEMTANRAGLEIRYYIVTPP